MGVTEHDEHITRIAYCNNPVLKFP